MNTTRTAAVKFSVEVITLPVSDVDSFTPTAERFTESYRQCARTTFDPKTLQYSRFSIQVYVQIVHRFILDPRAPRCNQFGADA